MAYNDYVVISDTVVAVSDANSIYVMRNSDYNESNMKDINELVTVKSRLAEHIQDRDEIIKRRTRAKKVVFNTVAPFSLVSLTACYLCAHLQMVPYNGDSVELMLRTLIPAAVFTGGALWCSLKETYKGATKKDLINIKKAIKKDQIALNTIENRIDSHSLDFPEKIDDVEEHAFNGDEVCRRLDTRLDIDLVYDIYHDDMVKAFINGKLVEYLVGLGIDLKPQDHDYLENLIQRLNGELKFRNEYEYAKRIR